MRRGSIYLSKLVLITIMLAALSACRHESPPHSSSLESLPNPVRAKPNSNFESLPPLLKTKLEAWKSQLLKNCSISHALGNPFIAALSVDLDELFRNRTPGIILGERGEFAILGEPEVPPGREESSITIEDSKREPHLLQASRAGAVCSLSLDSKPLWTIRLASQLPILAHYNPEHAGLTVDIAPSDVHETKNWALEVSATPFSSAVETLLSVTHQAPTFIARQTGIESETALRLFNLGSFRALSHSVLPIDWPEIRPFNLQNERILGPATSISELMERSRTIHSFTWILQRAHRLDPANDTAPLSWAVVAKVLFDGSVKDGGQSTVLSLQLRDTRPENPAQALNCFTSRVEVLRALRLESDEANPVHFSYDEAAGPCAVLATHLPELFLKPGPGQRAFLSLFTNLPEDRSIEFRGWDTAFSQFLESAFKNGIDLEETVPPELRSLVAKSGARSLNRIRSEINRVPGIARFSAPWIQEASKWATTRSQPSEQDLSRGLMMLRELLGWGENETSELSLASHALHEKWGAHHLRDLELLLKMAQWHSKCKMKVSSSRSELATCIGFSVISRQEGRILSEKLVRRAVVLAEALSPLLPKIGSDQAVISEKIGDAFWSPLWGHCSDSVYEEKQRLLKIFVEQVSPLFGPQIRNTQLEEPLPVKLQELLQDCSD